MEDTSQGTESTTESKNKEQSRVRARRLVLFELILLVGIVSGFAYWMDQQTLGPAPAFSASDIDGTPVDLEQALADG
ncbi:MAG: hypothetical protein AAGJ52_10205, partial [Pseudomonadota bacterium]